MPDLERIKTASISLFHFGMTYFPHLMPQKSGDLHIELCGRIERALLPGCRLAGALPREHAKTTWGTTIVTCKEICDEDSRKDNILIIGANEQESESKLLNVRFELEENPALLEDYGEQIKPKMMRSGTTAKLARSQMILNNGFQLSARPFMAKLRGAIFRASRYKLVILDDPENDRDVQITRRIHEGRDWVNSVLINSMDSNEGSIIWLGTILGAGALLPWAMAKPGWDNIKYEALLADGEPLWPERWPKKKLAKRRHEIGEPAWQKEFMNNPINPETALWTADCWRYYDIDKLTFEGGRVFVGDPGKGILLDVYAGFDPAVGKDRKNDYSAWYVAGIHRASRNIYVLQVGREKVPAGKQIKRMGSLYLRWLPRRFAVESVAFSHLLADAAQREVPNIDALQPVGSKGERTEGFALHFQQNRVYLPAKLKTIGMNSFLDPLPSVVTFQNEALAWPKGSNDDELDGGTLCHEVMEYGGGTAKTGRKKKKMFTKVRLDGYNPHDDFFKPSR